MEPEVDEKYAEECLNGPSQIRGKCRAQYLRSRRETKAIWLGLPVRLVDEGDGVPMLDPGLLAPLVGALIWLFPAAMNGMFFVYEGSYWRGLLEYMRG